MISAENLAKVFVEVADTLVADFDLIDFLSNLCEQSAKICDAAAVGILLVDHEGVLQHVAASSEEARLIELLQVQNAEGPCFECFRSAEPAVNMHIADATQRWPEFTRMAAESGFASVHALPMRLRDHAIGALNIFGSDSRDFDEAEVRIIQALADVATMAIVQGRKVDRAETIAEQLQGALESRITIEQAKGALSGIRDVDPDQAFTLMRTYARTNRQRLSDVAHAILREPHSIPALTSPN
ncbi:GAF and ANTAR domain-containing protein [Aeromicrobium sp.]|uniref:GAF and ANTAR domain-containing protein n=1 Tax=Aeromicrobium sp. TaxID=1871063 RepID=UPI002FCB5233